ncbi:MAG TPA: MFS transporter [Dehalococcoidales bacterium]|nr:MFS transporter [Dehalococcoidales bacterium]
MSIKDIGMPQKQPFFYGYFMVGALLATAIAMWSPYYAFGVFFKPVLNEFGWSRALTSGAFSLALVMNGLMAILLGRLNDKLGPRVVIATCGLVLGVGYTLMSQVNAVWQMYLFYGVIVGGAMGGGFVPQASTVARWFIKRRSLMTGIVVAGTGIGMLAGPLIATRLISAYDWRMSFLIMGGIAGVVVVIIAQFLKFDPARAGLRPYGESTAKGTELRLPVSSYSIEEAIRTSQFWLAFGLVSCYGFLLFAIMVHFVPYLTDAGTSETSAASLLATIGIMSVIGKTVLGSVGDKIGNKKMLFISFIFWALSHLWLLAATEEWMLFLFAIIFGIAYGGNSASHSPLVARLFGLGSHGLIFGAVSFGVMIGGAAGPFVAGYVFDTTGSYRIAFLLSAFVGVLGVILTALLRPTRLEPGGKRW